MVDKQASIEILRWDKSTYKERLANLAKTVLCHPRYGYLAKESGYLELEGLIEKSFCPHLILLFLLSKKAKQRETVRPVGEL